MYLGVQYCSLKNISVYLVYGSLFFVAEVKLMIYMKQINQHIRKANTQPYPLPHPTA